MFWTDRAPTPPTRLRGDADISQECVGISRARQKPRGHHAIRRVLAGDTDAQSLDDNSAADRRQHALTAEVSVCQQDIGRVWVRIERTMGEVEELHAPAERHRPRPCGVDRRKRRGRAGAAVLAEREVEFGPDADQLRRVVEDDVRVTACDPGVAQRGGARAGPHAQRERPGRRRLSERRRGRRTKHQQRDEKSDQLRDRQGDLLDTN